MRPLVSVIMPVYNAEAYVGESIRSVLAQTLADFELVVLNDGSTDNGVQVIRSFVDSRIRLIDNRVNQGLTAIRNEGLAAARGEYIAWLDADDLSHPRRLEKQVKLLKNRPEVGLCGTWVRTIGANPGDKWRYPSDPAFVKSRFIFDDPLATSSILLRRNLVSEVASRFDPAFPPAEDYELWERLSHSCEITNVPDFLTFYRIHSTQTSTQQVTRQNAAVWKIHLRQLSKLGIAPSEREKDIHSALSRWEFTTFHSNLHEVESWLLKLSAANAEARVFPEPAFSHVLSERWLHACMSATPEPWRLWHRFSSSPVSFLSRLTPRLGLTFAARNLKHWRRNANPRYS